jgi:hypothetical protein
MGTDVKMRYLGSRTPCRVEDQPDHQQLTAQQSNSLYVAIEDGKKPLFVSASVSPFLNIVCGRLGRIGDLDRLSGVFHKPF